jgi:aminoglycoside phosphotransferase family enzyme
MDSERHIPAKDNISASTEQNVVFSALREAEAYPYPVMKVEVRETHISMVFLTEAVVYKCKKAVSLDFLDFTTLEQRRRYCSEEVSLNRRLSDGIYQGVSAVTKTEEGYVLDGKGPVVEYAVRMKRLPDKRSMKRLLAKKALTETMMDQLVQRLVKFYRRTPAVEKPDAVGGWGTVFGNCEENFRQLQRLDPKRQPRRMFRRLQIIAAATRSFLRRRKRLFDRRVTLGRIRDGHGDLRCDHVYFTDRVQIIDCIEFNERFRYGDVAADLAFLAMDLDVGGHEAVSEALIDRFVRMSDDPDLFPLLDFYKCYRAVVRIKVNAFRLEELPRRSTEAERLRQDAGHLVDFAYRYALQMSRPTIWIVCGLPGSGKSTLAGKMAEVLDASLLRLDEIRKRLFDMDPNREHVVPFETGIYTPQASRLAYGRMLLEAQEKLKSGCSVILDATFADPDRRDDARAMARDEDVNLVFVECRAPRDELEKRLASRASEGGTSDARLEHLDAFVARFAAWKDSNRICRITVDTSGPVEDTLAAVLSEDHALLSRQVSDRIQTQK